MDCSEVLSASGEVVARIVRASSLWASSGLNFWSADSENIQVGTWVHPHGTLLHPHSHNVFPREAMRTQEAVYVVSGALSAQFFEDDGTPLKTVNLSAGDLLVCLSGGHGYSILEPDTRVLEIKNGPYFGPEKDRRRI